jgi:hypothetical protein
LLGSFKAKDAKRDKSESEEVINEGGGKTVVKLFVENIIDSFQYDTGE